MINYNENETENENGSHRYDINRTRPRHGHKYTEYKTCTSMMIVMCNKQHLSNIWSWIHEKLKHHWVEKKCCLRKACTTAPKFPGFVSKPGNPFTLKQHFIWSV